MRRLSLLVLVVAIVAAAYYAGTKHDVTSTSSTSTTATTAAPSTSTSTSSTTSSTTTTPTRRCTAGDLTGASTSGGGAAGTLEVDLSLTNTGGSPCSLVGYPSLLLRAASGASLPTARLLGGSSFFDAAANGSPRLVTLAVGQSAMVAIKYSDVSTGGGACPTAASIEVTVPGATAAVGITLGGVAPCQGGRLTVSPFYVASAG
jgi:hypothetical protein